MKGYGEFARRIYDTGILSDPWIEGEERFGLDPIVLGSSEYRALCEAAERMGEVLDELAQLVYDRPGRMTDLTRNYYGLTPWQRAMWIGSGGRWHGIARVDLFLCTDGKIRACEVNSDTPSGEAEAVLLNRLLFDGKGRQDPNAGFKERFWAMLLESHEARTGRREPPESIGIVYPTDLTEDLSMIAIYSEWLEARGCRVVQGAPCNLGPARDGRVQLLGEPIDLLFRHYKTDWWGEREVIWRDQAPYTDPDPLARELALLLKAEMDARLTIVNPFGAVVTQNKLSLALIWERQELFSDRARETIRCYLPETHRLTDLEPSHLAKSEWVLKSDYGCEGDSVVVGPFVTDEEWKLALEMAIRERWVAQRFFEVEPRVREGSGEWLPNYGLYLIGGRAGGIYSRLSRKATDGRAVSVATFIDPSSP